MLNLVQVSWVEEMHKICIVIFTLQFQSKKRDFSIYCCTQVLNVLAL